MSILLVFHMYWMCSECVFYWCFMCIGCVVSVYSIGVSYVLDV